MLRKCKVGKDNRPAMFHGWFQFGNQEEGMEGMAVVEFEDGKTDYFSPGYITFEDAPKTEDQRTSHNMPIAPLQNDIPVRGIKPQ